MTKRKANPIGRRQLVRLTPEIMRVYAKIPGHPNYRLSRDGKVLSTAAHWLPEGYALPMRIAAACNTGRFPHGASFGVSVAGRSGRVTIGLARALLLTYVGPPPSPQHVSSFDDSNQNNISLHNLRWRLRAEIRKQGLLNGTVGFGEEHSSAVHSDAVVTTARNLVARGISRARVATLLGLPKTTVVGYVAKNGSRYDFEELLRRSDRFITAKKQELATREAPVGG